MLSKKNLAYSSKWCQKYFMDPYAQRARHHKLRSRSWFKLRDIDHLDALFYKGMTVVDLGAAPGGWVSYVKKKIGNKGNIIACDLLPMKKISGVRFIQGDCASLNVLKVLCLFTESQKAGIVLSDMSPNTTGISVIDVNKSIYLSNVALNICRYVLISGGSFVVKVFQGKDFNHYLCNVKSLFSIVKIRKPDSSRPNSREVYIVAKDLKMQ